MSERPFTRTGLLGFVGPVSLFCCQDPGLPTGDPQPREGPGALHVLPT